MRGDKEVGDEVNQEGRQLIGVGKAIKRCDRSAVAAKYIVKCAYIFAMKCAVFYLPVLREAYVTLAKVGRTAPL